MGFTFRNKFYLKLASTGRQTAKMLKAALFAALYGATNAYDDNGGPREMCCTANVAMSNTYSICEDVMNKYSYAADQEYACLNDAGMTKGVATCKWTACDNVGYCVDERD